MNDFENAKRGRGGCHADPNSSEQGANAPSSKQKKFGADLAENVRALKELLPAEDILVYEFAAGDGTACAAVYADGITDKQLLGELAARPLAEGDAPETLEDCRKKMLFPEVKEAEDRRRGAAEEILAGNPALLVDGSARGAGAGDEEGIPARRGGAADGDRHQGAARGVHRGRQDEHGADPPAAEDAGPALCDADGGQDTAKTSGGHRLPRAASRSKRRGSRAIEARHRARRTSTGCPTRRTSRAFLARRPLSLFKQAGTTEKPDILCAKMLEGRIAVLADGSPIALTLPYMLAEDFQSAQDYFVSPYRATVSRVLRLLAVLRLRAACRRCTWRRSCSGCG